jgi:hypothetical protein
MVNLRFENLDIEKGLLINIRVELGDGLPMQIAHSFSNLEAADIGLSPYNALHSQHDILALLFIQEVQIVVQLQQIGLHAVILRTLIGRYLPNVLRLGPLLHNLPRLVL